MLGRIPLLPPPSPPFISSCNHLPTAEFSCIIASPPSSLPGGGEVLPLVGDWPPLKQKPPVSMLLQIPGIFSLPLLASIFLPVFKHAQVPLNSPQMLPFSSLFPQPQSHLFPSFHQHICPKNHLCLLTPLPDLPLTPQPPLLLPPLLWCNGTFKGLSKCPPPSYSVLRERPALLTQSHPQLSPSQCP